VVERFYQLRFHRPGRRVGAGKPVETRGDDGCNLELEMEIWPPIQLVFNVELWEPKVFSHSVHGAEQVDD